jgi:hypothetical protein
MKKSEKLTLTHETCGGYSDHLINYLVVIESFENRILRVYHIELPSWFRYFDEKYKYNVPNLN